MRNTYKPSQNNKYNVYANLLPFELLHFPKFGIFGVRVLRVVGIYVSGLTRDRNPYTTTLIV